MVCRPRRSIAMLSALAVRGLQRFGEAGAFGRLIRRAHRVKGIKVAHEGERPRPMARHEAQRRVAHDAEPPRARADDRGALQRLQRAKGRVLHDVLGVGGLARQRPGEPIAVVEPWLDDVEEQFSRPIASHALAVRQTPVRAVNGRAP